jgi:hypothetical protein
MTTSIITITSPSIFLRIALPPSLLRVGEQGSLPSAPCIEPGHSSKLAGSDVYARWTFLKTNFLELR